MFDHLVFRESNTTDDRKTHWKRIAFTCVCGFMGAIEGIPGEQTEKAFLLWAEAHEGRLVPNPVLPALPPKKG